MTRRLILPTYEYICMQCEYKVDYFQRINDPLKTECPKCHGSLKRMVTTGVGLIFKGSGFYETDYKKRDQGKDEAEKELSTEKSDGKRVDVKSKSTESVKEKDTI